MPIENRIYVRYVIRQSALLTTEKFESMGFTRDLSIRGLLFIAEKDDQFSVNDTGTLKLEIDNTIITVPCSIRHISSSGIGIAMEPHNSSDINHLTELLETTLKLQVGEKIIVCTPDNRLVHLDDWSKAVAEALAKREGINLTDDHWSIIKIMRDYYDEFLICPNEKVINNYILKHLSKQRPLDTFIYNLFPFGLVIQASRLAGIPLPLEHHVEETLKKQTLSIPTEGLEQASTETVEFEGRIYHFTKTGNLIRQELWHDRLAILISQHQNIELGHGHWEIIHFLRYFYSEYGIVPNIIMLKKHLLKEGGKWKDQANDEYLYKLFPKGPCRQGAIIGGLPEPKDCID